MQRTPLFHAITTAIASGAESGFLHHQLLEFLDHEMDTKSLMVAAVLSIVAVAVDRHFGRSPPSAVSKPRDVPYDWAPVVQAGEEGKPGASKLGLWGTMRMEWQVCTCVCVRVCACA